MYYPKTIQASLAYFKSGGGKLGFLFPVFIVALLITSCGHKAEEKEAKIEYLATSPLLRDTTLVREYVAQVHSIQHIELRALERGYLQKIYVDEGKAVKKGQLMFQILPILYQAELKRAQAETRFAEIEYLTTKRLADSNIVASTELAKTYAKYQKAKAEVSLAQAHLKFTEIHAPFDGIMDHYYAQEGSLLNEGDLLTNLANNSELWVYFNVPEAEYLDFKSRVTNNDPLKVSLQMANNKVFNHSGLVKTIEADFNNLTGNIAFRATFPNPEGLLRHGETGNILMNVPYQKALIIPQKATFEILDKKFVYVIDKNNVVHSREIAIEAALPDIYIIKKGLAVTDKVLLEGLQKVKENDKIEFRFVAPATVLTTLKVYSE